LTEPTIPAASLPLSARAPGKCIVFGEHAVVHGRPELVLAVDLTTQVVVRADAKASLEGDVEAARAHPYLSEALRRLWPEGAEPLAWTTISRIPRAAGLGSSAAFTAAVATALLAARGGADRSILAEQSFAIERGAQGVGSPGDTSASVAGGLIAVNGGEGPLLWELEADRQRWLVRRVRDPGWVWVLAYSGVPRSTADAVRSVGRRLAAPGGPKLLDAFEEVARQGIAAVQREERAETGRWMNENQRLLRDVGVSHPRLETLLEAVGPAVEGAKLTGAGAGGSIVALPKPGREVETQRRIERAGGRAFVVRASPNGADLIVPPS
jgi:mevalonate kinase